MTTNQIIRYHSGFVTSTIVSEYPDSQADAKTISSTPAVQSFNAESKPRRSKRSDRLPRRAERHIREESDAQLQADLSTARKMWATEAYAGTPDSMAGMRLAAGLSQTQLAKLVGTSQSHIAKIEAGHVRVYLDTANRLAAALEVDLERLNAILQSAQVETSSRGI
ncbi:helix-turn-helix domain-containing protein [Bordetella bronchiseptica]|uniref:helix-turn-helix domain-containing protein n=1 Tax=Bordetella bronchiseptica TaxID=518 RepID=UPI0009B7ECE1|nr:helix-turn-helix domain-containing protein [Bordetella bronchiseptica]AZW31491.1 helix-turn-helix domain-containing protein [Bordetella bronchiseptica]